MGQNRPNNGEPRKGYETTQQVTNAPYGPTQPALQQIIGGAGQQYQQGVGTQLPDFSPVAPLGPTSQLGIDQLTNLAQQGPGQNPYLQDLLSMGSENIANQVKAAYSQKGRYGSNDFTGALARGISEFQTPLLYNAYQNDQGQQLGVLDRLMGAGQVQDTNAQQQQTADYERALWEMGGGQNWALQNYLNTIGPIAGLGGTQKVMEPRTPFRDFLGTALNVAGTVGSFI